MNFIGVDPGKSGAVVVIKGVGGVEWIKGDETERDIADFVKFTMFEDCYAFIERVNAMPGQGVTSMFTFGRSYGFIRGVLAACDIPYEEVNPVKWQTAMGCRTKGDKNVSKARAQQLFPSIKVTHAIADALLIAEYCRREVKARR